MRLKISGLALDVFWTGTAAAALAFFIYFASSLRGYSALLLLLIASTLSVAVTGMLLRANRNMHNEKLSRDEQRKWLYSALYSFRSGIPYEKAMETAGMRIGYAPLKERVMNALRRRAMHASAVNDVITDRRRVAGELREGAGRSAAALASVEESAQRYATFNMFVSTVLPSFMTFAFIGSSILSRSSFSLATFASVLLLGLPVMYSLGNTLMWRRLLA